MKRNEKKNAMTVKFPFLDGDVPHCPSYGVYFSQFIRFAKGCTRGYNLAI